ncbi:tape measure protein, partial [Rhodococcus hoagii]|nr:tape measure protein [Prescottella equi]
MLGAGEQDTVKLTRAQEKLEAAERKLGEAKSATKSKSKDLSNAEKDLETKTKDAARAAEEQGRAVRVSSGDMDKAEKSAGKLGNTVSGLGSKLKSYGMIAAGVAGLGGIGTILTKGLDRLTAIDNAKAKLSGLGHEAASIDQIMQNAMAAVKGTAFGLGDAAGIAAGAVAAGVKPGQDLERTLKLVGDAASIAGVGMGDMGAIFNKVAASNKIQGDVIAQLSDAGIPIVQLLGKELNKTAAEVLDMASKGEIGFDTFQNAMEKGMGGAALKAGNTFKGAVDNAGAALGRLGATILDAPFKAAPGIIGGITESIDVLNVKTKGVLELLTTGAFGEAWEKAFPGKDLDNSKMAQFLVGVNDGVHMVKGALDLLRSGDYTKEIGFALGVEEDSKVVDNILRIRQVALDSFGRIGAIFGQLRDGAMQLVTPLGTIVGSLGAASAAIGFSAWDLFLTVLEALTPIIVGTIVPAVETLARLMDENQWAVTGLIGAYTVYRTTTMAAAGASKFLELWTKRSLITTKAHEIATKASTVATRAWGIAQTVASAASKGATVGVRALNAAIKANPIMAIVGFITLLVGALTWFFTKTELGKQIWDTVWSGIQAAMSAAWGFIRPIFEAIGAIFTWLYENIVQPIFTGLKIAFAIVATAALLLWQAFQSYLTMIAGVMTWLWQSVAQPIWALMQVGLQALGAFFGWVWSSLIKPAWDGLGAGISWVWNSIVLPVWNAMQAALNGLGAFFGWVWNSLIKPAWDGLGAGISWVWENVIRPAWDGLKGALQAIGDFFGWVWNTLIKPVWDALGAGINWVWENVIKRAFDGITSGLGIVRDAFDKAVGFIEQVWD